MALITLLLCTLLLEGSFGNTITPISGVENVKQGDNVTLQCNYTGGVSNLQWYRQYPGQALEYLLMSFETGGGSKANEEEHRISAELDKDNNRVFLKLIDTEVTDAAVYYCALRNTGAEKLIFGNGTRLIVDPKEKSETAAFVLGSDEDNKEDKARACLITDFSSHNISVNFGGVDVPVVPSVIKGDKQYSVVAFLPESKDRSNFNCNAFVNGNTTEGDNNDIENVCESDSAYVFESDEKLNSLSLMVLGLRVIFLKSIVFNVLMTVRAWMS